MGKTLEEIVRSVKKVTDMVAEIAAASREQNTGIDQVNTAVTQVDQVTQRNAAQTEELSTTAASLSEKFETLQGHVAAFQLGRLPHGRTEPMAAPIEARAQPGLRSGTYRTSPMLGTGKARRTAKKVANGGIEEF